MTYCICSRSVADYTSTALRIACTNNMHEYHDLLRICARRLRADHSRQTFLM